MCWWVHKQNRLGPGRCRERYSRAFKFLLAMKASGLQLLSSPKSTEIDYQKYSLAFDSQITRIWQWCLLFFIESPGFGCDMYLLFYTESQAEFACEISSYILATVSLGFESNLIARSVHFRVVRLEFAQACPWEFGHVAKAMCQRLNLRFIFYLFDSRFTSFIPKGYVDSHHKTEGKYKGKSSGALSGCASP